MTLDDKWVLDHGRVVLNGSQALVRLLLAQSAVDRRDGLRTAGYITGYRGSPLGNLDTALWGVQERLSRAHIVFQPGINEDLAATAVRGTQQLSAVPNPKFDGVFAAWYGKGPGVDRSCDALKHGNYAGTHPIGGVLVLYGDDHAGKSSTVAHQSEQALASCLIPSLYPANVQEIITYGLLGFSLSRYSGTWIGLKCVNEVAEQTATVDLDLPGFHWSRPVIPGGTPPEIHAHVGPLDPLGDERLVLEHRLPLVQAFVRANGIDRVEFKSARPRLGLVTAGKTYGDVREALTLLGLDDTSAAASGISLYKVGCIWPLEPKGLKEFASGHAALFVIEEKKSFLEQQVASLLINASERQLLLGKQDEHGQTLLSASLPLDGLTIAQALLRALATTDVVLPGRTAKNLDQLSSSRAVAPGTATFAAGTRRLPFFCSGCPHNRSTKIPEGSLSMTGIGCHTMVNSVRPREALLPAQMGGEGGNWIGLAPFTATPHMFQNMGDGTYFHSGLLAIRAAVAAKVNITYKILYNDAVAMTGGQPIDGPISVQRVAHQVRHEGVQAITLVTDDPARYEGARDFPEGVHIAHRDTMDDVQRQLRATPGCTVLIYEQTCAAEKRRRRRRGTYPDPPKRLFISTSVCEGCGDCSAQSTCVSLVPVDTPLGRKRAIDQSSCNKDYSCLNGFCPSFLTIYGAEPQRTRRAGINGELFTGLPEPAECTVGDSPFNVMIAGIGGTGVVTVGALLGMAAHLDGFAMSVFDMTGLAQKNGAVYSHLRIAHSASQLHAQRIGHGQADVLLAFDTIAALGVDSTLTLSTERTRLVINSAVTPTAAFQFDRDLAVDSQSLLEGLRKAGRPEADVVDAAAIVQSLLGDTVATNLFLVGLALQRGLLPLGAEALEAAITLNGVAVALNLDAFRLGRLYAADPDRVLHLTDRRPERPPGSPTTLTEIVAHRAELMTRYQNSSLARRYEQLVESVRRAEQTAIPGSSMLARAAAVNYAKLLAYKDEYEVARLLTDSALTAEIITNFGEGARIALSLAPPFLNGQNVFGRPRKREFSNLILPLMRVLARLRFLRGTAFDPFGRNGDRRLERSLIAEYEELVNEILRTLTPANHRQAVTLLSLADEVRGYGAVKAASAASYRARMSSGLRDYRDGHTGITDGRND